jgi:molecular chaperone GrpE (heat shock protein)
MGHLGSAYEKYYTPTHIARDFQAIYFGAPSEEELIRSVASMGLSRDRRAPTELDDDQQKQVRNDPVLVALREKREKYKKMLKNEGFYPLTAGKGTRLYNKYERKKRELASTYQQLHRIRLNEVIREFHDSIDTIEITRQLSGKPATEVLPCVMP